ncbi:hypothetical protein ACWFNE_02910 [Cellulomonas sp. NPDC055163]
MRLAAAAVFLAVFVPISWVRRVRASSRFGTRYHQAPSAWDVPSSGRPL